MSTDTTDDIQPLSVRLHDGVELLGQYQGSGLREAPYLIRRPDGQVVQVSPLIHHVASILGSDGPDADLASVAASVTDAYGRDVTAENVVYLIEHKLRPAGLVRSATPDAADGDGTIGHHEAAGQPEPTRAKPLLALRMRVPLVPERVHRLVTTALVPLFRLPVVVAALAGLVLVDVWLLHRPDELAWGLRRVIYQPQLLLLVTLVTLAAAAFHELGHAAAARRGGARPGAMGVGIYLVWPVFYTDVSDSYRLSRRGRLRTDLGGVYFNVVFALGLAGLYGVTGFEPLLVSVVLTQIETLRQFLPFVRLDGYYVVSDLAGVPNLFAYMQPVLVGLLRRRDDAVRRAARAKLRELTPAARALIVVWVCITAPVLLVNLGFLLVIAPRLAGAAWGSAAGQIRAMIGPGGAPSPFQIVNGTIGILLLVLPVLGLGYVLVRSFGRVSALARAGWRRRPAATGVALAAAATLVLLQVGLVWPDSFSSALRHAQESPAVEDAPAQIAGPPVPRRPETQVAAPAPATAPPSPPAAPAHDVDGTDGTGSTGRRYRGGEARTSGGTEPSQVAGPSTTVPPGENELAPGGGAGGRRPSTTTTTTTPGPSTTLPAAPPEDPIVALLQWLFPEHS